MKIGILSDTHSRHVGIEQAFAVFKAYQVGAIIHGGDWVTPADLELCNRLAMALGVPLFGVFGNNDYEDELRSVAGSAKLDDVLELELDGRKIGVCHGHVPADYRRLQESDNEIIISGHSHKPIVVLENGKLHINPGSTAYRPTVAIYDSESHSATIVSL